MGVLQLKSTENYYSYPLEGTKYYLAYDNSISSIEKIKNERTIERTTFGKGYMEEDRDLIYKKIEYYDDDGYTKNKEISFYSNGNKQSEITYNRNYEEVLGIYYNLEGKKIATFDYLAKQGTKYNFFYNADQIRLMEEWKDKELIKRKKYDYSLAATKKGTIGTVLVEDVDINCCASFYERNGELLAYLTIKDGKPWEGTYYNEDERTFYEIKKGERNGIYRKVGYNGETQEEGQYENNHRTGVFKSYDNKGNLFKTEPYVNDKLNGTAFFYDDKGKELASMQFENDKPMNGKMLIVNYSNEKPTEETFKNGVITQRVEYDRKGKNVIKFQNGNAVEYRVYYPNQIRLN